MTFLLPKLLQPLPYSSRTCRILAVRAVFYPYVPYSIVGEEDLRFGIALL